MASAKVKRNRKSSAAAVRRNATTGRFEKVSKVTNDRTPFAQGGNGLPDGWSVSSEDKPSKRKKQKRDKSLVTLPEIIRHSDPVEPASKGLKAMFAFAGKMIKAGYPAELSGKAHRVFKDAEAAVSKKKKTKVKKETKKDTSSKDNKNNNE
ncbi:MAG TPA: hypothetical protein VGE97_02790 [Nitrososphaera sp.]|jgi:hypothetical protein